MTLVSKLQKGVRFGHRKGKEARTEVLGAFFKSILSLSPHLRINFDSWTAKTVCEACMRAGDEKRVPGSNNQLLADFWVSTL